MQQKDISITNHRSKYTNDSSEGNIRIAQEIMDRQHSTYEVFTDPKEKSMVIYKKSDDRIYAYEVKLRPAMHGTSIAFEITGERIKKPNSKWWI